MRIAVACLAIAACSGDKAAPSPIRFLHTFGPEETELFNQTMSERGIAVESSLVPFARGQQVISEILHAGTSCPDLIRIDSTWLALLEDQLLPVPPELSALDWLPEAPDLRDKDRAFLAVTAVPQTIDGLVIVRDAAAPAPASTSINDLVAAARAAQHDERKFPLGLRVDGYWFVAWLRANGADLARVRISRGENDDSPRPRDIGVPGAVTALAQFASLFGTVAAPPPPSGSEAPEELRRWTSHDVAYWVTGPWQLGALRERDRIEVSALEDAPRGGQLLAVPRCAKHPSDGWHLASELTSVSVETTFAEAFATVPSRRAALEAAPPLVGAIYQALRRARPLQRSEITPLLFDDLNPALAAVIAGDATAEEAIEGVRRGWSRLSHGARR
ncbi:MAG: extracellular solute-binding protein family 1 [Myxococcales bacterium]|nr:extracellular solute-binding protein family 1 [Myxococcales bacterium]